MLKFQNGINVAWELDNVFGTIWKVIFRKAFGLYPFKSSGQELRA